jgi:hypothetical protein
MYRYFLDFFYGSEQHGNLTVARWPNFRLNNSKEASKKFFLAGKWQILSQIGRKEADKSFTVIFMGICHAVCSVFLINKASQFVNQDQFLLNHCKFISF